MLKVRDKNVLASYANKSMIATLASGLSAIILAAHLLIHILIMPRWINTMPN